METILIDFQEHAVNGQHLWVDTDASGSFCYLGDECMVSMYCCAWSWVAVDKAPVHRGLQKDRQPATFSVHSTLQLVML